MVGAIDAVCDVAQRIIGKLKEGTSGEGPPLLGSAVNHNAGGRPPTPAMKRFAHSVARQKGSSLQPDTRNRDPSAVHSSTGTRPRKSAMNRLGRPAPNRQVRRRYCSPKRLRGRRGSSFPTRPRPVRLPCPHGLHQTWARSVVRVVARLPTPASRRDQRRPNRQGQRGGHGNTRPLPVAVQQRMLARVRDQDESLGILIRVFAINPAAWSVTPNSASRRSPQ